MHYKTLTTVLCAAVLYHFPAYADEGHAHKVVPMKKPTMMSSEHMEGRATGLLMPMMNAARGRTLFASKGCVACHSINGVGGKGAPPFDVSEMPAYMNPFEFAARMWRGAATMVQLQEEILGEQIELTGTELGDIIAFVHDADEQRKFSEADIPPRIRMMIEHTHVEGGHHD